MQRTSSTPGRKPVLGDAPRDRLHEAAQRCMERHGPAGLTVDEVAREAGVSRPTVYYYFASKEDLVLEVLARRAEAILETITPELRRRRGLRRILHAAHLGTVATMRDPYLRVLLEGDGAELTARLTETDRLTEIHRRFWKPLLEHAHRVGELRDDREYEEMIHWILFQQFALAGYGAAFGLTVDDVRPRLEAYLVPALAAPHG